MYKENLKLLFFEVCCDTLEFVGQFQLPDIIKPTLTDSSKVVVSLVLLLIVGAVLTMLSVMG